MPARLENMVGKRKIAKNGMGMTIVAYRNSNDIDIRFDDGTLVEHRLYNAYKAGTIKNPNLASSMERKKAVFSEKRIGEKGIGRNGMEMTLVAYRGARDIDVLFSDGVLVEHKFYANFKKGFIQHPDHKKTDSTARTKINAHAERRVGQQVVNKWGDIMTLIAYRSAIDVDVQFEDGTVVKTSYNSFIKGLKTKKSVPKDSWDKTGESKFSSSGIFMTIKQYNSAKSVLVEFEDGAQVICSYGQYTSGYVLHPYFRKNSLKNVWVIGDWIVTGLAFIRDSGAGEFYCKNEKTNEKDIRSIPELLALR